MSTWAWAVLGISVQNVVGIFWNSRIGKGRIFSRPMWRLPLFRPVVSPYTGRAFVGHVRIFQVIILAMLDLAAVKFGVAKSIETPTFWLVLIALYMDDYLTGDDDRWKRFKDFVKNTVKWKMKLPVMTPQPTRR